MSNSNKVAIDKLSSTLMKYLTEYKEDIEEDVKEVANKNTKEAQKELKQISPRADRTVKLRGGTTVVPGSYAKSWSIRNGKKAKDIYSKIVYNKEHYRLTHLLEFGHAKRDGSRNPGTKKIPHIRTTEDKYRKKFIEELEVKIRRQS